MNNTMLDTNRKRTLAQLSNIALKDAGANPARFDAMNESTEKGDFTTELTTLYQRYFGRFNPFNKDSTLKQTFFEPKNWSKPIQVQIEALSVYLPGIAADADYLTTRLAEPVPTGFTRVAVPKLAFLQTFLQVDDIYAQIDNPIEQVCEVLEGKHGEKFKNWRKGELGTTKVRCNEAAAAQRKLVEAGIQGDVLILDADLGNRTLGGKDKLCHSPRWSREEIGLSENLMHLSAVDVGWILAVNPARLTKDEDLSIDVTLEEYFWDGDGWVDSLYFYWDGGQLHFDYGIADDVFVGYAAGVALLSGVPGNSDFATLV